MLSNGHQTGKDTCSLMDTQTGTDYTQFQFLGGGGGGGGGGKASRGGGRGEENAGQMKRTLISTPDNSDLRLPIVRTAAIFSFTICISFQPPPVQPEEYLKGGNEECTSTSNQRSRLVHRFDQRTVTCRTPFIFLHDKYIHPKSSSCARGALAIVYLKFPSHGYWCTS